MFRSIYMFENFSNFTVYVDESGDHGLRSIDPDYPVFVLSFCVFHKTDYSHSVMPAVQNFKYRWFGTEFVILHESEISKRKGAFAFLQSSTVRERFMDELSQLMVSMPCTIIASVIRKQALVQRYSVPRNPYELALLFCLERLGDFLVSKGEEGGIVHVNCEARSERRKGGGPGREDAELMTEFRKIVEGQHHLQQGNHIGSMAGLKLLLASKLTNSAGLQVADLTARPIGLGVLRPQQNNRALDIIRLKLWQGADGCSPGAGLKIFP